MRFLIWQRYVDTQQHDRSLITQTIKYQQEVERFCNFLNTSMSTNLLMPLGACCAALANLASVSVLSHLAGHFLEKK